MSSEDTSVSVHWQAAGNRGGRVDADARAGGCGWNRGDGQVCAKEPDRRVCRERAAGGGTREHRDSWISAVRRTGVCGREGVGGWGGGVG
ncbi:hypothetical protein [Actinoplanes derwentensis]|uniref:hypothetical protein n=1 Tax=Actinoplanes derwentensis TaxID=113562 RepID=UPI0012FDB160|nr:hypothetical protein [Actinoplanes derwentensis]